ncbi:hypothetical protein, partial [Citrobacter freundii]|uniref:hypothetical protein n=1 Tax=Citrobacter freundii TaxID=546 RepID=UPI002F967056
LQTTCSAGGLFSIKNRSKTFRTNTAMISMGFNLRLNSYSVSLLVIGLFCRVRNLICRIYKNRNLLDL